MFNEENFEKLYEYFVSHTDFLCECCKNNVNIICEGKSECPHYYKLTDEEIKERGYREYPFEPWMVDDCWSCMTVDNGEFCYKIQNSPCVKCYSDVCGFEEGFDWNGEVK